VKQPAKLKKKKTTKKTRHQSYKSHIDEVVYRNMQKEIDRLIKRVGILENEIREIKRPTTHLNIPDYSKRIR